MDNAIGYESLFEAIARVKDMPSRTESNMFHVSKFYSLNGEDKFHDQFIRKRPSLFFVKRDVSMENDRDNCIERILGMGDVVITNALYDFKKCTPFVFDAIAGCWSFRVFCKWKNSRTLALTIRTIVHVPSGERYRSITFRRHEHETYDDIVRLLKCGSHEEYVSISFCDIAAIPGILRDMGCVVLEKTPLLDRGLINTLSESFIKACINDCVFFVYIRHRGDYKYKLQVRAVIAHEHIDHKCRIRSRDDIWRCIDIAVRRIRGTSGYLENGRRYNNEDAQLLYVNGKNCAGSCDWETLYNANCCEINVLYIIAFGENDIRIRLWYEPQASRYCQLSVKGLHRTEREPVPFPSEYHTGTFTEMLAKMRWYVDTIFDILQ